MAMTMSGLAATGVLNRLNKNENARGKNLKTLASGLKIGGAEDDASGYAISKRMSVQIRSLEQDSQNAQNGTSLIKTAGEALQSTVDILKTLKEKAIDAANDSNTDSDRANIQKEVDQAFDQIDDNANTTYNGQRMLDGSRNNEVVYPGSHTYLTNDQLADDTEAISRIINLKSKNGLSLNIVPGDTIEVSYVKNGVTYSNLDNKDGRLPQPIVVTKKTRFSAILGWDPARTDLDIQHYSHTSKIGTDQYGNDVYTPDGKNAISYHSAYPGVENQIAGLTITVYDANGHKRNSANNALNHFEESIRAQDPSEDCAMRFQIGTKSNQATTFGFEDMRSSALGLRGSAGNTVQLTTRRSAAAAINVFDNAVKKVLDQQTELGAFQDRLLFTYNNIKTSQENTIASQSTIADANMAKEATEFAKNNVLTQSAQAMLAQANQSVSSVLSLLQ
ncbi:flagellin [Selenomonas bovis]|uniref:flagellin N-terminal helical domain-containing protein n=1 Tax=Selenomonas bovis TaxID=416586 RepID=UPI003AB9714F